ncbi:hypothetical protein, partial [Microbulbifer thermotolerans]
FLVPVVGGAIGGIIDLRVQLAQNDGNLNCVSWGQVAASAAIGAALTSVGPGGALFGRSANAAGRFGSFPPRPGVFNRGNTRFGWSFNRNTGRQHMSAHGGQPRTPSHWHRDSPISLPAGDFNGSLLLAADLQEVRLVRYQEVMVAVVRSKWGLNMVSDSVQSTLEKIVNWAESLPKGTVQFAVDNNPSVNFQNCEYHVDFEVKISPVNRRSLPLTIWLSGNAIGFFVSDFKTASNLINSHVSNEQEKLACAGTEPVTSIDDDTILRICDAVSNAKLEIIGGEVFGSLKGMYTRIEIGDNRFLTYNIGLSLCFIKFLSIFGISKQVKIPCQKW